MCRGRCVVVLTIAAGGLVGWVNGVLVEYAKINSFIATLGVGTILYGLGNWYTNGTQLVGNVPQAFADLNDAKVLGIPLPTYMVAAVAILAWVCLEHMPVGRQLYAIGSNRKRRRADRHPGAAAGHGRFVLQRADRRARRRAARGAAAGGAELGRARSSCCRPSSARCSARPPSGRAGSTPGARSSPCWCWRSASPACSSSATRSSSSRSSRARR